MKNEPLVSIIMNCYNGEKYLRDAINSVINQTYKNWELIFWDNKSTDKSAEIFNNYNDVRLNYYCASAHTSILYEAKNFAIKKAKGDFLAFLDVDDWWLPEKLEKQIPLFNNPNVGLVYGNLWRFFEKKNKKKIYRKKTLPIGMILDSLIDDYVISSATYVVRRKSLESLKHPFNNNFHIIGDFDLSIRLASKWKFDCVQSPVAVGRIHGQNQSLLKKHMEISEMKNWYNEMKQQSSSLSKQNLEKVKKKYLYVEAIESLLSEGFKKSFLNVVKYPFSFKKFKLIMVLLLPKFLMKKLKNY